MVSWGLPLEEAEDPLLPSSCIVPSSVSPSPSPSPMAKKEETKRNLTQILREIPHYQDVVFEPLRMAETFSPTIELPPGVNTENPYSLFSLFFSEDLIGLLSSNTNKYAKAKNAGQSGREWHKLPLQMLRSFLPS